MGQTIRPEILGTASSACASSTCTHQAGACTVGGQSQILLNAIGNYGLRAPRSSMVGTVMPYSACCARHGQNRRLSRTGLRSVSSERDRGSVPNEHYICRERVTDEQ